MDLVEVYIVRAKAPEAVLAALDHVLAGEADIVGALAHREADLRSEHDLIANAFRAPPVISSETPFV